MAGQMAIGAGDLFLDAAAFKDLDSAPPALPLQALLIVKRAPDPRPTLGQQPKGQPGIRDRLLIKAGQRAIKDNDVIGGAARRASLDLARAGLGDGMRAQPMAQAV